MNDLNGKGVPAYHDGDFDWTPARTVPWGSNAWVHLSMTWTVPETLQSDGLSVYPVGTVVQPTGFIAIIQAFSSNPGAEGAAMYVRDAGLYVQSSE
jgi:hypothetical protein